MNTNDLDMNQFSDALANARKGNAVSVISFDMSDTDKELLAKIVVRGMEMAAIYGVEIDSVTAAMDIAAVHCNSCPLNLLHLLMCNNEDFSHDFCGIGRWIDRSNGALRNDFKPRNAKAKQ